MKYKLLGRSGLRVSEVCLGTMTFGNVWGWGSTKEESKKIFDAFNEAGGNFIDTANYYTEGTSETYLGEFMKERREEIVLATKYTLCTNPQDVNAAGNQRKNLVQAVRKSLERLQTDYIDLLWVHAYDGVTPIEETMRALDDMVRQGKVLYVGVSDFPAWIISRANTLADERGWSPFIATQIEYSLIERTSEREIIPMAKSLNLGITPWSPLGGGILTGKYFAAQGDQRRLTADTPRLFDERIKGIVKAVTDLAAKKQAMQSQIALHWLRQQHRSIIPIIGARTLEQLEENLGCLDFSLSNDELEQLSAASNIELGFPHDFLSREKMRKRVLGEKADLIETGKEQP